MVVRIKPEAKAAIKRFREHDSDTESEYDDVVSGNITTPLPDLNSHGGVPTDHWHDSPKSEVAEPDKIVFLSFDWENEGPYEKAVERSCPSKGTFDKELVDSEFTHFLKLSPLFSKFVI